jgi:hypothetical protein
MEKSGATVRFENADRLSEASASYSSLVGRGQRDGALACLRLAH